MIGDEILIENLKNRAGDLVYKRGVAYYSQGHIKQFTVTPLANHFYHIQAVVQGAKSYIVNSTVQITGRRLKIDSYCSCPYDWSDLCKHKVAVLYRFLFEEYHELSPTLPQKPPRLDGVEILKQALVKEPTDSGILNYRLKGLQKVSGANFRLRLIGGIFEQEALVKLIEDMEHEYSNSFSPERLLRHFSNFDRLVIEHLQKIHTRKDPSNSTVFFTKSAENLEFILTLLANREVYLEETSQPLLLGERITPRVILNGNESHLKTTLDLTELCVEGCYHPELDCIVKGNVLQMIDPVIRKLPDEMEIPPQKLGAFLFEVLPALQQKIPLELPPELAPHQLNLIQPQIRLDFDYRGEQMICLPRIRIDDLIYDDKESLKLTRTEPEYHRSETDKYLWSTINQEALQNFVNFLERYNFTVSPEGLTIKDSSHLIRFITEGFKQIPPDWQVTTSQRFTDLKISPVSLDPVVELNMGDEIDWFEFTISYNLGGQTFTHQEIMKMIRQTSTGQKYIQTGNQIFLLAEIDQLESIEKKLQTSQTKAEEPRQALCHLLSYRRLFQENGITIKGNAIYNQFEADITGKNLLETCQLPENLNGELRQYQKEGFYWLHFLQKYKFNGILADDMGLGKTLQVLTLIKSISKKNPALVVCPRSLIYNWAAEIDKFYPGTGYLVYHGPPEERRNMRTSFPEQEMIITTYDILARDAKTLLDFHFDYCILDEAQHIKNHLTQRAREVKRIKALHRLVMTGTPIENGLEELWSIFDFLMPGYLESQLKFTAKYVAPLRKTGDQECLKQLKHKVAPFILRRKKEEVLTELPEKIISLQNVFMTKLQEDAYRAVLEQLKKEIVETITEKGLSKSKITVLAALTKLRQICNHPQLVLPETGLAVDSGKLDALMELIYEAIDGDHKIIVFSQFVKMLKIISTKLHETGICFEYLDGATRDRMERINHFNETPEVPVFLISLKAGGVGINLTSADIVIHVDPWWNPMVENQATDRVHRIGQKNQVMVYKLITLGTVEEKILQLQKRKKSLFDIVVENNQSPVSALTWEDIKELFEL